MGVGGRRSEPSELARVEDRLSFVYLEHCTIARDANALTATDESGVLHVPSAGLLVLLLGPGTRVTHAAMSVIADGGACVVWVGENGVRYYAGGRPIGRSTRLLQRQAALVSNTRTRLDVARRMYGMRFPEEDVSQATMQQLRGREGSRVRRIYREWAKKTGVAWSRRDYDPDDFDASDAVNRALSAAHACLYGVVHGVVVALGCAPGLGFVHTGHDRSFVYDIADLYKADITIPVAFQVASSRQDVGEAMARGSDVGSVARRAVRDAIRRERLLPRIVRDLETLLLEDGETVAAEGVNELWDERSGPVEGGTSW
ncbi:MAG: type I-E CRISPR-associated endonuclease Cas1e [Pseudoclavibacter sp.]|nr:type I-E CRISPR-associated endonuclease Cas1e [Pseudoclavibacter sp.]